MKKPSATKSLLKIGQAAKALGVSIDTLRRWERAGKITAIRTPGGTRLYSLSSLKKINPQVVSDFEAKSLTTEELLKRVALASEGDALEATQEQFPLVTDDLVTADYELPTVPAKTASFVNKFLIGTGILSAITLAITSWIAASYLTQPKATQEFFKNNVASGLLAPFNKLAEESVAVISPKKAQELGFIPQYIEPPPINDNPNVLAVTASPQFLEINSDTQINGSLFVRDQINNLSLEGTPSASTITLSSGETTLTVSNDATLDQDVSTTSTPAFNFLNLSATSNQLVFQSGGPSGTTALSGTLTWTPTAARIITLPDATTTLVGRDTTDTLKNKSISGSDNTLTAIPNSALSNNKVTVTAGTNLTGGGDVALGSSITISLKGSPAISGVLSLADGTAAAPSLTFSDDADSGLYRIGANRIGLITGGSATSGITIDGSGNLGIGNITPSATLYVSGNAGIGFTGSSSAVPGLGLAVRGNVGIGTTTANNPLSVAGGATFGSYSQLTAPSNGLIVSGNVGIGTSAPQTTLDVNGDTIIRGSLTQTGVFLAPDGSASAPAYSFSGDTDTGLWRIGSNQIALTTAGGAMNGLAVNSSGNVGIGNTSASQLFQINPSGTSAFVVTSGGNVGIGFTSPTANLHVLNTAAQDSFRVDDVANDTSPFVINSDGNVGIANSAPSYTLDVVGTGRISSLVNILGNVGIGTSGVAGAQLQVNGGGLFGWGTASVAGPSNGLAVSGNVGIGTTSPTAPLQVWGNNTNSAFFLNGNVGIGWTSPTALTHILQTGSADALRVDDVANDTSPFVVNLDGNVGIANSAPSYTLDVVGTGRFSGVTTFGGNIVPATSDGSALGTSSLMWSDLFLASGSVINFNNGDVTLTHGTDTLSIAGGNVGIGTTIPNRAGLGSAARVLTIEGQDSNNGGALEILGPNVGTGNEMGRIYFGRTAGTGPNGSVTGAAIIVAASLDGNDDTGLIFYTSNAGSVARRMTIDNAGNVGIGMSAPDRLLHVASTIDINPTNAGLMGVGGTQLDISGATTNAAKKLVLGIDTTNNYGVIQAGNTSGTNYDLILNPAGGNVGIGYTSPTANLHVLNTAAQDSLRVDDIANDTTPFIIDQAGNVGIGATTAAYNLDVWGTARVTGATTFASTGIFASTLTASNGFTLTTGALSLTSTSGAVNLALTPATNAFTVGGDLGVDLTNHRVGIGTTAPTVALQVLGGNVGIGTSAAGAALQVNGGGIFWPTTTSLTGPTNGLAISGNVGIGTTTANSNLSVAGNAHIGSLYQGIAAPSNGLFVDGNVGIGATTSSNKLDVWGNSRLAGTLTVDSTITGSTVFRAANGSATTPSYSFTSLTNAGLWTNGDGLLLTTGGSSTSGITVTGAGSVGIGTTAPKQEFSLVGDMTVANGGMIVFERGGSDYGQPIWADSVNDDLYIGSSNLASPYTGSKTAFMTIKNSGNVGIGYTTPTANLHVLNTAAQDSFRVDDVANDTSPFVINLDGNVGIGATTSSNLLDVWGNARITGTLTVDGNLTEVGTFLAADGTVSAPAYSFSADTNTGLFRAGTDALDFTTGGTERLTITAGGNIGIGITSPGAALEITGNLLFTKEAARTISVATSTSTNTAGGALTVQSGTGVGTGVGGALNLTAGNGGSGGANGGAIVLTSGSNGGTGSTGAINLTVSSGSGSEIQGGAIALTAGDSVGSNRSGGAITLTTGYGSQNTGTGGAFSLTTGRGGGDNSGTAGNGGAITLTTGNAGDSSGSNTPSSGAISLITGTGQGADPANTGNLTLRTGAAVSTGTAGTILFQTNGTNTRMAVNGGGNVGIGTSVPGALLVVTPGNVGIGTSAAGAALQVNGGGIFWPTTTSLTGPTNGLAISGNVGIGTTTANSNLSVAGNAHIGGLYQGISAPANGLFVDGNVGIGATTSSNLLDVWGNTRLAGTLTVDSNSTIGGTLGVTGVTTLSANNAALSFTGSTPSLTSGSSVFGLFAGGNVGIGTTGNVYGGLTVRGAGTGTGITFQTYGSGLGQGLTVLDNGNVGIGTTAPSSILEIEKDQNTSTFVQVDNNTAGTGAAAYYVAISDAAEIFLISFSSSYTTSNQYIADSGVLETRSSSGGLVLSTNTDTPISFWQNNAEKMRIAAGGNVGIGFTSPTALTHLVQTAAADAFRVDDVANDTSPFVINQAGNVGIGATTSSNLLDVWGNTRLAGTLTVDSTSTFGGNFTLSSGQFLTPNGSASLPSYSFTNSTSTGLWSPSINALSLTTNGSGTSGITITAAGSVGIGTTTPDLTPSGASWKTLTIAGPSGGTSEGGSLELVTLKNDAAGITAGVINFLATTNTSGTRIGLISMDTEGATAANRGGVMKFYTKLNGGAVAEKMRINSDGNVGIGTALPSQLFQINASGTSAFVVTSTGNVGIGFTSPDRSLQVALDANPAGTNASLIGTAGTSQLALTGSSATGLSKKLVLGIDTTDNYGVIQAGNTSGTNYDLSLNPAGGNVGIGTTNPARKLVVSETGATTGAITIDALATQNSMFEITKAGTVKWEMYVPASSNDLRFYDGTATPGDRITFQGSTGNVGIGFTSPTANLHVLNTAAQDSFRVDDVANDTSPFVINQAGNVGIGATTSSNLLDVWGNTRLAGTLTVDSTITGSTVFRAANGSATTPSYSFTSLTNAGLWTNGDGLLLTTGGSSTSGITVTGAGSVGIGTTAPKQEFSLVGDMTVANGGMIVFERGGSDYGQPIWADSVNDDLHLGSTNLVTPYTGSKTAFMTLQNSGNVGIGITTANSRLSVAGGAHIGSLYQGIAAPSNGLFVDGNVGIGATTSSNKLDVWGNSRLAGTLTVDSNSTIGGTLGVTGVTTLSANNAALSFTGTTPSLTSGSSVFGLFAGGNVGIGTTGNVYGGLTVRGAGTGTGITFQTYGSGLGQGLTVLDNGNVGIGNTSPSQLFQVNPSGTSAFVVTSTGNVGIGWTTPRAPLEVLSTTTPQFRVTYDASNYLTTAVSSTGVVTLDTNGTGSLFSMTDPLTINPTATTLTTSLQAYWKMDENSGSRADSVGSNTLSDNNTVTSNPGKIGNAAQFTAANSEYLSIEDNAALSAGDIDFSLCGWVYIDTMPPTNDERNIVGKGDAGLANGIEYWIRLMDSAGTIRFQFGVSNGTTAGTIKADTFGAPSLSTWYFVCGTHSASANTVNISVNDGAVDSASYTGGSQDTAVKFVIGAYPKPTVNSAFFGGRVEGMGFWKKVLTAAEKTELYNGGTGLDYPFKTALDLNGDLARTIQMQRHTTSNTAGNSLTLLAGGTTAAATDKNGGNLILQSGVSTGTGTSQIQFWTVPAGSSGTTDNAAVQRMTIDGAGNVGIGTTGPVQTFQINPSGTSAFVVTSGGNVGIGFTSPVTRLHVIETSSATANTLTLDNNVASNRGSGISFRQSGTQYGGIALTGLIEGNTNNDLGLFADGAGGDIFFYTGGSSSAKAVIQSGGNVGIGFTSPTALTHLVQTAAADAFRVDDVANDTSPFVINQAGNVGIGATSPDAQLQVQNGTAWSRLNAGDSTFAVSSSRTIKENFNLVSGSGILDKIQNVPVYTYDYISGPTDKMGLVAEDFYTIFGRGDGTSINYQEVAMASWLGIQELNNRTQSLQSQLYVSGSGNVGIGTTNPLAKLDVAGNARISGNLDLGAATIASSAGNLTVQFSSDTVAGVPTQFIIKNSLGQGLFSVDASGSARLAGTLTTEAGAFDVAEDYPVADETIEAGDVVSIADHQAGPVVEKSSQPYQNNLLGIVSTNAALRLSSADSSQTRPVALNGRVPVKVSTENGPIEPGDYLTSSSTPGVAMKAKRPGPVVGKALEPFDGSSTDYSLPTTAEDGSQQTVDNLAIGKILVFVNVSYADPGNFLASLSLDDQGNLIIPKIRAGSIILDQSVASASAQLSIVNSQLSINEAFNVAEKFASQSAQIANLDLQVATASASIAFQSTQLASASAELASIRSEVESLRLTPPDILLASGSATLASLTVSEATVSAMLTAYAAQIQDHFKVLGETTIGDTIVAGQLTIDGTLSIENGNSINVISTLYLQNSPLSSSIDIFNGKVTIDSSGNIQTSGQVLASEVKTNKLTISNTPIASSSATLAASIGTGTIPANQTKVTIPSTNITAGSKVFITPTTATDKVLSVTNIKNSESFDVSILTPASTDIKFNWWIVQTE